MASVVFPSPARRPLFQAGSLQVKLVLCSFRLELMARVLFSKPTWKLTCEIMRCQNNFVLNAKHKYGCGVWHILTALVMKCYAACSCTDLDVAVIKQGTIVEVSSNHFSICLQFRMPSLLSGPIYALSGIIIPMTLTSLRVVCFRVMFSGACVENSNWVLQWAMLKLFRASASGLTCHARHCVVVPYISFHYCQKSSVLSQFLIAVLISGCHIALCCIFSTSSCCVIKSTSATVFCYSVPNVSYTCILVVFFPVPCFVYM